MSVRLDGEESCFTYLMRIAYDGTRYHGWQYQEGVVTIEGILRETFERTFGHKISLCAASRTDTGVHAYDQVASFVTPLSLEPSRLQEIWNRTLPIDIVIRSMTMNDQLIHPRYDVKQKIYWYHIFTQRPLPFIASYGWYCGSSLNFEVMRLCLDSVVGTHDFRSFCTGDTYKSTVRTIDAINIQWLARFAAYRIAVRGRRFMHFMIRRIVGAAVMVSSRRPCNAQIFYNVFQQCDPRHHLVTAPASGLLLRKIYYT